MPLNALGIGSLVFLILYAILFFALLTGMALKQIKPKSRWSFVLIHVSLRLAAQSVGLAFAIKLFNDGVGLLIAYIVLGAEGYFSLVLCTCRYLISFQNHAFGDSWIEPKQQKDAAPKRGKKLYLRIFLAFFLIPAQSSVGKGKDKRYNYMAYVHSLMVVANVLIVVGASFLSNGSPPNASTLSFDQLVAFYENDADVNTGKALRTVGQAIFFGITLALVVCLIATIEQYRKKARAQGKAAPWYGHSYLLLLWLTTPFLVARGVFGIVQAAVNRLSWYFPTTYDANGLAVEFVIKELVLAIAMEWCTCALLVSTWPVSRFSPVELVGAGRAGEAGAGVEPPQRAGSEKTMPVDEEEKHFGKQARATS